MKINRLIAALAALVLATCAPFALLAQEDTGIDTGVDDVLDQGLFEDAREEEGAAPPAGEAGPEVAPPAAGEIERGEAGEGQTRWTVSMTVAVLMNYVFTDSNDSFTIRYRFEIKGTVNAETAVLRGDLDINADVQGSLAKWPTGECTLSVNVPKVPYELTFRKTGDDKTSLRLVLRRAVNEDWQSRCTFSDSPGARLETRGAPETWLAKALEKARPPLKDLIADIGEEETTTRFIISKEQISDPPLGSGEIEGTGVITIRPGGE